MQVPLSRINSVITAEMQHNQQWINTTVFTQLTTSQLMFLDARRSGENVLFFLKPSSDCFMCHRYSEVNGSKLSSLTLDVTPQHQCDGSLQYCSETAPAGHRFGQISNNLHDDVQSSHKKKNSFKSFCLF